MTSRVTDRLPACVLSKKKEWKGNVPRGCDRVRLVYRATGRCYSNTHQSTKKTRSFVHFGHFLRKTTTTNSFEHSLSFINSQKTFLVPSVPRPTSRSRNRHLLKLVPRTTTVLVKFFAAKTFRRKNIFVLRTASENNLRESFVHKYLYTNISSN